jgi:hypothetical protein
MANWQPVDSICKVCGKSFSQMVTISNCGLIRNQRITCGQECLSAHKRQVGKRMPNPYGRGLVRAIFGRGEQ